jgi:hypothetical protein
MWFNSLVIAGLRLFHILVSHVMSHMVFSCVTHFTELSSSSCSFTMRQTYNSTCSPYYSPLTKFPSVLVLPPMVDDVPPLTSPRVYFHAFKPRYLHCCCIDGSQQPFSNTPPYPQFSRFRTLGYSPWGPWTIRIIS